MDEESLDRLERVADPMDLEAETLEAVHHEAFMRALWPEVRALPVRQIWAFVLHMETDEVLAFVQNGCCSMRGIAECMGITLEEFVQLYRLMPLPDEKIAGRLQVTGRQVINLRKCARERLGRRLREWAES